MLNIFIQLHAATQHGHKHLMALRVVKGPICLFCPFFMQWNNVARAHHRVASQYELDYVPFCTFTSKPHLLAIIFVFSHQLGGAWFSKLITSEFFLKGNGIYRMTLVSGFHE